MNRLSKAGFWMLDYAYSGRSELRGILSPVARRAPRRQDERAPGPQPAGSAPAGSQPPGRQAPGRQPVVLLPGVYERWHVMLPVARQLERLGHPVYLLPELGRNVLPIDECARVVARYLERHDLRDVVLIGHSKGGLIGKYLMLRLDPEHRVDRLIAVNTPFSGSVWADRLRVRAIRMFAADDLTVTFLGSPAPVNERITSVFGAFDQNVPAGSVLPGARNRQLPVAGHTRILGSRALATLLADELART